MRGLSRTANALAQTGITHQVFGHGKARDVPDGTQDGHGADQADAGHLQQKRHVLRPGNTHAELCQGGIDIRDLTGQVVEGIQVVLDASMAT